MKYLMSRRLLAEDIETFMREHKGDEFVSENTLSRFAVEAILDVIKRDSKGGRATLNPGALIDNIIRTLIADVDAIVCYPKYVHWYDKNFFNKKIIAVEKSEE